MVNHFQKDLNCVDTDQEAGMEKALDLLIAKGHQRIGFLSGLVTIESGMIALIDLPNLLTIADVEEAA